MDVSLSCLKYIFTVIIFINPLVVLLKWWLKFSLKDWSPYPHQVCSVWVPFHTGKYSKLCLIVPWVIRFPPASTHLCFYFPLPSPALWPLTPDSLLFLTGGHINPAVSFAMCVFGRMEWFKLPFYVGAQFLGAFVGAAAVFGVYYGEYWPGVQRFGGLEGHPMEA